MNDRLAFPDPFSLISLIKTPGSCSQEDQMVRLCGFQPSPALGHIKRVRFTNLVVPRSFGRARMDPPLALFGTCFALLVAFSSGGILRHQIVGGHEAKPHSRPYAAALKINGAFGCGGFLVAPQWVMSAAHCMGDIMVVLGAHDLDAVEETQQVFGVASYHPHPGFHFVNMKDDILLLKLDHEAILNKNVQTIPLPTTEDFVPPNTNCVAAGWGLIDADDKPDSKLYETNVTVANRRQCLALVPFLSDGQMCAGSQSKLSDVSHGDSGSALMCNGVAHGIVSFGYYHPPSIYTRIAAYLPWIQSTMDEG